MVVIEGEEAVLGEIGIEIDLEVEIEDIKDIIIIIKKMDLILILIILIFKKNNKLILNPL